MRPYDLVVRGDVVTASGVLTDIQIAVRNGRIISLHTSPERLQTEQQLDARGQLIFPGIVDAHVHCYSYQGEGVEHTTRAAAAGGVTTIVDMPFDAGGTLTTADMLQRKRTIVDSEALVDVALLGTIAKNGDLSHLAELFEGGVCGLKLSLTESDPVRFPRINDGILYDALPYLAGYGLPVGFHAENDEIVRHLTEHAKTAGQHHPEDHGHTRPPVSEYLEIAKLLEFARYSGVPLHLNHLTLSHSVELARQSQKAGVNVTTETCPHYLLLDERDMQRLGMRAKVNPPMRDACEPEALWRLVLDGHVDILASDHAPWPLSKKTSDDIFANASGTPGVETFFPLMFSEAVVKRGAKPSLLVRLMVQNPLRRYALDAHKGCIMPGMDADLSILDPGVTWTVRAADMLSVAGWTPFEGRTVHGKVTATVAHGRVVYDGQDVLATPGDGRFVPANPGFIPGKTSLV